MDYHLRDKTIIITGENSGIGKTAAIQQARLGASVVLACRSKQRCEQAMEEVKANQNAYNKETQKRLWAISELLTIGAEHDLG